MAAATGPAAITMATAPIMIPALLRAHDMRLSLTQPRPAPGAKLRPNTIRHAT
jgi:hypothetical protein